MFVRFIQEELLDLLGEFPAIAITGPRQAGKTTLAKQLGTRLPVQVIYIDLENPRDENKLNDPVLFFENNADKCIILDEIQRRKDLFPVLRAMIDQNRRPARFILSGSASPEFIRDSSESLAGRIIYKELTPLHLLELDAADEKNVLIRGGFPNSLLSGSDKMSLQWREGFIQTYVEKDLPLMGLPVTPVESRRILRMLAHLQGQLVNYASLAKSLGVSSPSIKKYLQFLEHAFLIELLEPFTGKTGKRITKSPKVYLRDSGVLNYLLGIYTYNDLLAHPHAGAIWEGFVIQQIRSVLPFNTDRCFYRTQHGAEIDLVISLANQQRIGVEIKFSSAPALTRGNYEAMKDLNLQHLYVITPTNDTYHLKENVEVTGTAAFLHKLIKDTGS
jgi:uncharacterized protein